MSQKFKFLTSEEPILLERKTGSSEFIDLINEFTNEKKLNAVIMIRLESPDEDLYISNCSISDVNDKENKRNILFLTAEPDDYYGEARRDAVSIASITNYKIDIDHDIVIQMISKRSRHKRSIIQVMSYEKYETKIVMHGKVIGEFRGIQDAWEKLQKS